MTKPTFSTSLQQVSLATFSDLENEITQQDVAIALQKQKLSLNDFLALISEKASPYLEQIAQKSQQLTQQRFGKTIQLYVPLYLSNMCSNICTYCGFSMENKIRRITLNEDQIRRECEAIKTMGFDHILLVTGESERNVGMNYFNQVVPIIRSYFEHIAMEVQPLSNEDYKQLKKLGVGSILVYQETYDRPTYAAHHLKGKKANFDYRLQTPERVALAGIDKVGLGSLFGLGNWKYDAYCLAMHLQFMEKYYWQSRYAISFPRLRPCEGNQSSNSGMTERQLLQLICAFRLFSPTVELSLSTRETAHFRNNALALGVTTMSAGSVTQPGGYADNNAALEQFSIDDNRSVDLVADAIRQRGYEVIWKDWSAAFS